MRMDCGLEAKDKFNRRQSQRSIVLETSHIAASITFSRILAETICPVITKSIPHPFPFHETITVPPWTWTDANRRQSDSSSTQEHGQRRHSQNSNQQLDAANKIPFVHLIKSPLNN